MLTTSTSLLATDFTGGELLRILFMVVASAIFFASLLINAFMCQREVEKIITSGDMTTAAAVRNSSTFTLWVVGANLLLHAAAFVFDPSPGRTVGAAILFLVTLIPAIRLHAARMELVDQMRLFSTPV